jgi:O-antigen/teichoic acid export membrane protein
METIAKDSPQAHTEPSAVIPRDARRNVLVTVVGRPATIGLSLVAMLWLIRYLDPGQYGVYLMVFTLITILDLTLEVSFFTIAVREIAKSREAAPDWVGAVTLLRGSIGAVVGSAVFLSPLFVRLDANTANTLRMGALVFLVNSLRTPVTYFRGLLVIHWELIFLTLSRAIELALIILICSRGGGVVALMGAKALASALFVAAVWFAALWWFQLPLRSGKNLVLPLFQLSVPLGLTAILVLVRTKGDILLIGWILGAAAAGAFGAVAQIPDFGSAASGLLMATTAPLLAQHLGSGKSLQFQSVFQKVFDGLVTVLPGLAAVGCVLAGPVLLAGLGEQYAAVVPDLRVLIWVAAVIPIAELAAFTAVTLNLQVQLLKVEAVSVLVTLAGNLLLLGFFGTLLSAWIRLGLYLFGLVLTYGIIRANSEYRLSVRRLIPIGFSVAIAAAATALFLSLHPVLAAVMGLAAYAVSMIALSRVIIAAPQRARRASP